MFSQECIWLKLTDAREGDSKEISSYNLESLSGAGNIVQVHVTLNNRLEHVQEELRRGVVIEIVC